MCNLFENKRAKRWLDRSEETKPKAVVEERRTFKEIFKQAIEEDMDLLPKELMKKIQEYIDKQEDPVTDEEPEAQDEFIDN